MQAALPIGRVLDESKTMCFFISFHFVVVVVAVDVLIVVAVSVQSDIKENKEECVLLLPPPVHTFHCQW